jgi:threonine/homoserine/homoserine lactone efflux protein
MPAWSSFSLFVMTAATLLVTPGPAVLYIVDCSLAYGRRAGLVSALGTAAGYLLYAVATTLGISAVLTSSAVALRVVQYIGAACLIYHGLRTFVAPVGGQESTRHASRRFPRLFVQGILVTLCNPVTALFFCAVLPRFVDLASGAVAWQMLWLGCLYVVMGLCNGSLYALLAGTLSHWRQGHGWYWRTLHCLIGSLYIALGLSTALARVGKM